MSEKKRILVVDDEKGIRDSMTLLLESYGYEVHTAASGFEALEFLEHMDVELVVSDVKMPNGSGMELLAGITNKKPPIPTVLLISGYTEVSEDEVLRKGGVGILSKPLDYDRFFSIIQDVLED